MKHNLNLQQRLRKQANHQNLYNVCFGISLGSWLTMSIYTIFALGGVVVMPEVTTKLFDALIFVWLFFTGIIVVGRIIDFKEKGELEF